MAARYVARQKPLKIGQTVGNDYEVRDGIKPGDKVIISGTQFLRDGAPVIPHGLGRPALGFRCSLEDSDCSSCNRVLGSCAGSR